MESWEVHRSRDTHIWPRELLIFCCLIIRALGVLGLISGVQNPFSFSYYQKVLRQTSCGNLVTPGLAGDSTWRSIHPARMVVCWDQRLSLAWRVWQLVSTFFQKTDCRARWGCRTCSLGIWCSMVCRVEGPVFKPQKHATKIGIQKSATNIFITV